MKLIKFFSLLFLSLFVSSVVNSEDIVDNGNITCNVDRAGCLEKADEHIYHFDGVAKQTVIISIGRTGGRLRPHIALYKGNEEKPIREAADIHGAIIECNLPETDSYTIKVKDEYEFFEGCYGLSLLVLGDPSCVDELSCDSEQISSIRPKADIDGYTFHAKTGDTAIISLGVTEDPFQLFYSRIALYDSKKEEFIRDAGGVNGGTIEYTFTEEDESPFTIVVSEAYGVHTGSYGLSLVVIGNPSCASALSCDSVQVGYIDSLGDIDGYTFRGKAGDTAIISIRKTVASYLDPFIDLYDSTGKIIGEAGGVNGGTIEYTFTETDFYTVVVFDEYNDNTGGYEITLDGSICEEWPPVDLTSGYWQVNRKDDVGGMDAVLVFQSQKRDGENFTVKGYFDWVGRGGYLGESGREVFDGTFFADRRLQLQGTHYVPPHSNQLGLGLYEGEVDETGTTILNGTATNGALGTWKARLFNSPMEITNIVPVHKPGDKIVIKGRHFGEPQSEGVVHIGGKAFDEQSGRMRNWKDNRIAMRLPDYPCEWFGGKKSKIRKVWVTVDGVDTFKKSIKILNPYYPDPCPE